jgi:hypothetical protein|tara:strand:- start:1042 stop:1245 length:204 start_codon:yes stop_codon:yes gene_type:complete
MMANDLYIYENMLKMMRERRSSIQETICHGAVADFTAFKELRARLGELAQTEQDLKDLLKKVSDIDE